MTHLVDFTGKIFYGDGRFKNIEQDAYGHGDGNDAIIGGADYADALDKTKNAYLLYYEKRRKQKMKILLPR